MFLVSVKNRGKCCSVYPLFGCIIDVVIVVVSNFFLIALFSLSFVIIVHVFDDLIVPLHHID